MTARRSPRPLPHDPQIAAAVAMASGLSRRQFLARSAAGAGAALLGPSLLAACATPGSNDFTFSNWVAYIDEDDDGNPRGEGTTLAAFEEETGIPIRYLTDYNDNDEYFNRSFSPLLGRGKRIAADLVAPTYWMAARLKSLGWLEQIDLANVPNHANLADAYLDLAWDPGATSFMPWQAGIGGLAYNPELTGGPITSMEAFFDPKYKGQVTMLTELRDSVGLTMMMQGASAAEADRADVDAALDQIEQARNDGQILKFTGNEYLQGLQNGDYAMCVAWSGDIFSLGEDSGIEFVVPETGGTQWFDAMVIPKGSRHKAEAEAWMNFVYDPENAARITEWVGYISPVKGVKEVLLEAGGDSAALAEDPLVFPDEEISSRLQVFGSLEQQDEIDIQTRFNEITG